ncbi:Anthocyanin 5-aromatic acyltransferase [Sesamum alatum]|uniref:Anthocyanin 5-aromatic acyltransferase n=1 Tax=Sesamum alatum TaxID=300844 RepID=A0AAE1YIW5_9LAMI|nr:Anthocyanin 5-aromatic acyltransferase [Sesamum alatum]
MATILQRSQISPALDSVSDFSLPIVSFDMIWYGFPANQSVLFFDFPCSKSHFLETLIPDLKSSLSLTLNQFLPLAGNIIHLLKPGNKPILRYETGDSVSFTVSESSADFNHLTGNHPRGLCIGFVTHHAVADASTVLSFVHAWALIDKSQLNGADNIRELLAQRNLLPFYDRKAVTNLNGLDSIYWDVIVDCCCPVEPPVVVFPINKLRATLVLKKEEIGKLKNLVLAKCPNTSTHLSSFTIICALVWVCWANSAAPEVPVDQPEYFGFMADCRGRLNPPLPANYFGNCVAFGKAELKHGVVKGSDGFVIAAKAIGEAIKETVAGERGILYGAEKWVDESRKLVERRHHGVVGSPRFDFYVVDYGWGKPNKFEILSIDRGVCISLCKSRDFEGGFEIGLSKSRVEMEAFTTVFKEILQSLLMPSNFAP